MTGIDGSFRDACVVCRQGTDTALGFDGEVEWAMSGLDSLGVPEDRAEAMVLELLGATASAVPAGRLSFLYRVCQACADKAGLKVGLVVGGPVPHYHQPGA